MKIEPKDKPRSGLLHGTGRMPTVPFDEGKLAHSEPYDAVSDWQKYNDVTGAWAASLEEYLAEAEASEGEHPTA